jgi:hypothetical protein
MQHAPRPAFVLFDLGDTLLLEQAFDLIEGIDVLLRSRERSAALAREFEAELELSHEADREIPLEHWLRQRLPELPLPTQEVEACIWRAAVKLSPGQHVTSALEYLAAHAVPMGVVSNAPFSGRALTEELSRHGLSHYSASSSRAPMWATANPLEGSSTPHYPSAVHPPAPLGSSATATRMTSAARSLQDCIQCGYPDVPAMTTTASNRCEPG